MNSPKAFPLRSPIKETFISYNPHYGTMTEYRIRVDPGLMAKIKNLTKDTDIRTNSGRLRWIVNRLEHLQQEQKHECKGVTKADMETILGDLRRGY